MPEIITTGLISPAIQIQALEGETNETIRANARNLTVAASIRIYLIEQTGDDTHGDLAFEYLLELGMNEINACRIVGGAAARVAGLGVTFKTHFLEPGRTDGPRVYEDFKPINRNNQPK